VRRGGSPITAIPVYQCNAGVLSEGAESQEANEVEFREEYQVKIKTSLQIWKT